MTSTRAQAVATHDLPLAAKGLDSYRYRQAHGFIMIGARSDAEALSEAKRSLEKGAVVVIENLEKWVGGAYAPAGKF